MFHSLKNIKRRLANKIKLVFQDKTLEFENKDITIDGADYFLCRTVISTIPEMVALEERSQHEEDVWNDKTFQLQMKEQNKSLYIGLRQADQLVGFIGCRVNTQMTRMRIMRLTILPSTDAEKIAATLVNVLFKKGGEIGVRSIFAQVRLDQEKLGKFYHNMGFRKAGGAKSSERKKEVTEYQFLVSENKEKIKNG